MERTYHDTAAAYILPNDAPEHERLNEQAAAITSFMHGEANHAPLERPQKILEVGCGTGVMLQHFLQKYGTAQQVIGVDLSTMPPLDSPKVTFVKGDFFDLAKSHPQLQSGGFDYIFSRLLVYGLTDWPGYVQQAKDLLAPGGWLELQEGEQIYLDENELRLPENDAPWLKRQFQACADRGLDTSCAIRLGDRLRAAGFVDVHVKQFRWVIGKWNGHPETDRMGIYSVDQLRPMFLDTYRKTVASSVSAEELEADEKQINDLFSWSENGKHVKFQVAYGRKP